jgi:hypothetical protein
MIGAISRAVSMSDVSASQCMGFSYALTDVRRILLANPRLLENRVTQDRARFSTDWVTGDDAQLRVAGAMFWLM